ncbi:MAG: type II toxin-antitoxin system VapC family toxin [Microcoleus sp.]
MTKLIFLDTGVVGKLIHPLVDKGKNRLNQSVQSAVKESIIEAIECNEWLETLINAEYSVAISEIVNYEARRDLVRRIRDRKSQPEDKQKALKAIQRLDALITKKGVAYFPVTCEEGNVMQEAAELWAFARNNSYVAYDADLIIAAQAVIIKRIGIDVIIATTDTEDFNRLLKHHQIEARRWRDIKP